MKNLVKIKENYEFRRAYQRGKALVTPYAVVYVYKSRYDNIRLGITAGKKIGKAVSRNRAKRLITAAFRSLLPMLTLGYDYVIVARTRILTVKSTVVEEKFRKVLKEAGFLNASENDG